MMIAKSDKNQTKPYVEQAYIHLNSKIAVVTKNIHCFNLSLCEQSRQIGILSPLWHYS